MLKKKKKNISKINYTETMETSAGNVEFQNTVRIVKTIKENIRLNGAIT